MAKSYKKQSFISEMKFFLADCFSQSKIKIVVTLFILFVSLVTGIILAVKFNSESSMLILEDYGIVSFVGSGITTSFFSRLLSVILIMIILFGCSFSGYCLPFAVIILAFRTYLLGFNLCLMLLTYGLSGIIISIFIILPCQLLMILVFCAFYFILHKCTCDRRIYGGGGLKEKLKITLVILLLMVVICLLETLLLLIFNANVIIVI